MYMIIILSIVDYMSVIEIESCSFMKWFITRLEHKYNIPLQGLNHRFINLFQTFQNILQQLTQLHDKVQ